MAAENFEVAVENVNAPVTALSFVDYATIVAGEGSILKTFRSETPQLVANKKVFQDARIHYLKVVAKQDDEQSTLYAVLGGKAVRLVEVLKNGTDINLVTDEKRFSSWIWDVVLLRTESGEHDFGKHCLAFVTSQNNVFLWHWKSNGIRNISYCSDQCILYSAAFWAQSVNSLTVAVGTVFSEVLIWKPLESKNFSSDAEHLKKSVDKRLKGHEGVIFSVVFQNNGEQLLSVSDDRSIRLWDLRSCSCLCVFYGHTARVWSAVFFGNHLVSIGEDAACILWKLDGSIIKKFKGHKGKSIWSLAVDFNSKNIATGGGDGGIRLWSASKILNNQQSYSTSDLSLPADVKKSIKKVATDDDCSDDYPRTVRLLDRNEIVVLTNNGSFLHYNTKYFPEQTGNWNMIFHDEKYSSYCCLDVDREASLAVLGSLSGIIKVVKIGSSISKEVKAFDAKTLSIFILKDPKHTDANQTFRYLIASGPEGMIIVWSLILTDEEIVVKERGRFRLPYCRQRWAAAVAMIHVSAFDTENSLKKICFIVGDRRGSLHVFHGDDHYVDTRLTEPTQSVLSVHGKTGVTSVVVVDNYIYTSGRDGFYRKFYMNEDLLIVPMDRKKVCKGMDWIEGLKVTKDDILVYGFYMQSYFAVWSSTRNEMLIKIHCGGGYRSWDLYMSSLVEESSSFIYLKGPIIKFCVVPAIRNQKIIKDGLHGREVNCIRVLGKINIKGEIRLLFASGSEDTLVHFVTYSSENKEFHRIHSIDSHIGSIKSICFLMESAAAVINTRNAMTEIQLGQSYLLFTCGSRTSLKCTRVYFQGDGHVNSSLLAEIGTPINSLKSKSRMVDLSDADDLRFLSLVAFPVYGKSSSDIYCIAAACSDANIRIYGFSSYTGKIQLITSTAYHARCVQVVRYFYILVCSRMHHFVLSGGTDGRIALWDLTKTVEEFERSYSIDEETQKGPVGNIPSELLENNTHPSNDFGDVCHGTDEFVGEDFEDASWNDMKSRNLKEKKKHTQNSNYFLSSILHSSDACSKIKLEPLHVFDAHQSGIHSIDVVSNEKDFSFLLASGGDDNALFLSKFTIHLSNDDVLFNVLWTDKDIYAHHSTITAVRFATENLLITSSVDQRIKIWKPSLKKDSSSKWQNVFTCFTDIADVSDLECWTDKGNTNALVSGVGIELKQIKSK